jgi:hypothetical protein
MCLCSSDIFATSLLAVVGVASDDTGNSAARRNVIFIVGFLDCGLASPERRLSCVGIAHVRLK